MEETQYFDSNQLNGKDHPKERANIITKAFFCWFLPLFVRGLKKELNEDDMYGTLKEHEASSLGDRLEQAWNYEVAHKKNPSLGMAIVKIFRVQLVLQAIFFTFRELVVKLSQPILITQFLKYYEPDQTEINKDEGHIRVYYAALIVTSTLLIVLCFHNYQLWAMHLGLKIRVAVCSLIYRKALKLNNKALAQTTVGQMVNLLSNDVGRFNQAVTHINFIWMAPLQLIIISYLLYVYVGIIGLVGTAFLLLFTPCQMYMGKKTSQYRLKTAIRTDERIRLMSEIINGIQVIKMYSWEKPFAKLVEISRRNEIQQIQKTSVIRAIIMSLGLILNRLAIYLCILVYVLTGHKLNATFAYTVSSFYNNLRDVLTNFFPKAVTYIAETNISMKRIEKFLTCDEIESNETEKIENGINGVEDKTSRVYDNKEIGVHLKNISAKWENTTENILEDVSFQAASSQLIAIVGPVGAGKTTLLHVILKELSPTEGEVKIHGSMSYASQEPWLFGGSVRQNIIFGQLFDPEKYKEVIRVCALDKDFALLPYSDRTLVGDRGVTLSGGQKARVTLARAIYKDADIYLLDDPLSAVDTHVGRQIFDECIYGYLKSKCVILVTHQLQYLGQVKTICVLENGKVTATGSYEELQSSTNQFTKLLVKENEEDGQDVENSSVVRKDKQEKEADGGAQIQSREQRGTGVISQNVYRSYFKAGGSWFKIILIASGFLIAQIAATFTDYFINLWVNLDQTKVKNNASSNLLENGTDIGNSTLRIPLQDVLNSFMTENVALIIYTILLLTTVSSTLIRSISFFRYCMTASTRLHNKMFNSIVYTSMRFFNTNPPGRILNRFSKDIGIVDEMLPLTIIDTIQVAFIVIAISLVNGYLYPWVFLPTLIILVIFYFLRVAFLSTSRNIKRVEAVTRSPIFTHLSASLRGLTTIRAFGAQEILKSEFDNYQNLNSAPSYMFIVANRTFGFWLDFHCVVYLACVIISILFIEKEIFGGNVGLALTQSITLTGQFQWGMRQWSELENNMTSVERVQEYAEIVPEKNEKNIDPPKSWPEYGAIKFDRVFLRYSSEDPFVLQNLNFDVKPKEKIGIVGRTGAGKSSLIVAIFRLTDIEGNIYIDNINTKDVELATFRSKISIIPQDPVLFSGTLRKNLDPFDEYSDEVLWNALDEVELKSAISDLPAGLESKMSEGGSNFSVGQRQLLCLARCVIRNNKILILDEATANVDPHTDGLIQTTIRRKFADCTVLTIAHRLNTIMDSDKILVMDAGKVVEFDHPHKLLQDTTGMFYQLVKQTGVATMENLITTAEDNYKSKDL